MDLWRLVSGLHRHAVRHLSIGDRIVDAFQGHPRGSRCCRLESLAARGTDAVGAAVRLASYPFDLRAATLQRLLGHVVRVSLDLVPVQASLLAGVVLVQRRLVDQDERVAVPTAAVADPHQGARPRGSHWSCTHHDLVAGIYLTDSHSHFFGSSITVLSSSSYKGYFDW